jgi:hypothetical protein
MVRVRFAMLAKHELSKCVEEALKKLEANQKTASHSNQQGMALEEERMVEILDKLESDQIELDFSLEDMSVIANAIQMRQKKLGNTNTSRMSHSNQNLHEKEEDVLQRLYAFFTKPRGRTMRRRSGSKSATRASKSKSKSKSKSRSK